MSDDIMFFPPIRQDVVNVDIITILSFKKYVDENSNMQSFYFRHGTRLQSN
jgi:hypothetical protein